MSRRTLVLGNEAARHPFRARLPHRRRDRELTGKSWWQRISMQDLREFLMAYCACFLAVSLYIA